MADISLYLTNVNVSLGRSMDVVQVSEQLPICLVESSVSSLDSCVMSACV